MIRILLVVLLLLSLSCKEKERSADTPSETAKTQLASYSEEFRPHCHFSPPLKWINNPNISIGKFKHHTLTSIWNYNE